MFGNISCSYGETRSPLSLSSSRTLKHLTLSRRNGFDRIALTSTLELSFLKTLHLDYITLYDGFFSKCPNLENLTLNSCNMMESKVLRSCHPRLSNTLDDGDPSSSINVVTPRLKDLTITKFTGIYIISAPELASLLFSGGCPFKFSTDGFHSLEKAQSSLCHRNGPKISSLVQECQSSFIEQENYSVFYSL